MKLEIGKIVGSAQGSSWSQVHTFLPEEKEKLLKRGQLLAIISLTLLKEGLDAVAVGREIISRLHEEYYGNLGERPLLQLKRALERVSQEANGEVKLEIGAMSLVGQVLYLALIGSGSVVIQRGNQTTVILKNKGSGLKSASGYLENNDLILLGSQTFFEMVAQGLIQAAMATGEPEEAAEVLAPAVYGKEQESLAAALIIKATKEAETEEIGESIPKPIPKAMEKFRIDLKFLAPFRDRVADKLKNIFKKINRGTIYLTSKSDTDTKSKKTLFTVSLVLLILLGVSVFLGAGQRKRKSSGTRVNYYLTQADLKKEEGLALVSLNPIKARESLQAGLKILDQAMVEKITDEKLTNLKKELETSLLSISKEYQVTPAVFYDLGLIKKEARGIDLSMSNEWLLVLDADNLSAYDIGIADKKYNLVAGGQDLEKPTQITALWPKVFILTTAGIIQADTSSKKQGLVIKADSEWLEPIDLANFGGNLYLLDKKGIWQYSPFAPVPTGATAGQALFSSKKNWLKSEVDLNQSISLAIDGVIWVLKKDGTILKLVRGVRENFTITGLSQPLAKAKAIFTDADQKFIYILDGLRVVVLGKTGEYQAQYPWSDLEATGLAVSEKAGKIYLLSGANIYAFEIKKEEAK